MAQTTMGETDDTAEATSGLSPDDAMPWFKPMRDRIDQAIAEMLAGQQLPPELRAAVDYALLSGGKRVRPVLCLLSATASGCDDSPAMPAALALELIHTFSLIHDDLPALDDDDLRRGRPTLHIHDSEAMAILVGDLLQTLAFEILAASSLQDSIKSQLTSELAVATRRMIVGQVLDTLGGFTTDVSPADRLQEIHKHKTGALIRASCRMGAIAAGAPDEILNALTQYGDGIGLMFQIMDDVLDVTQSTEHLGKGAGKDEAAGKLTFPGVYGLVRSREMIQQLREQSHRSIAAMGPAGTPLVQICDFLAVRTR